MLRSPLFQLALTLLVFAGLGVHLWNLTHGRRQLAPPSAALPAKAVSVEQHCAASLGLHFVQQPEWVELGWAGHSKKISGQQLQQAVPLPDFDAADGLELSVSAKWPADAAPRQCLGVELQVEGHMPQLKSLWSMQHDLADVLQFEFSPEDE